MNIFWVCMAILAAIGFSIGFGFLMGSWLHEIAKDYPPLGKPMRVKLPEEFLN